jgi:hypothetical protein
MTDPDDGLVPIGEEIEIYVDELLELSEQLEAWERAGQPMQRVTTETEGDERG